MADLKACPFCGSSDVYVNINYSGKNRTHFYFVRCDICGGQGGTSALPKFFEVTEDNKWDNNAYDRAVERWNNRAEEKEECR